MSIYVTGDIHGDPKNIRAVVSKISKPSENDFIIIAGAGQTRLRGVLCTLDLVPDPDNAGVGEISIFYPSRCNLGGFYL